MSRPATPHRRRTARDAGPLDVSRLTYVIKCTAPFRVIKCIHARYNIVQSEDRCAKVNAAAAERTVPNDTRLHSEMLDPLITFIVTKPKASTALV